MGFELPRDLVGNLGLCGRRSSDTACEDGIDSSKFRPDSLKVIHNINLLYYIQVEIEVQSCEKTNRIIF